MDVLAGAEVASYVAGKTTGASDAKPFEVLDPWTGQMALRVLPGTATAVADAISAAMAAFKANVGASSASRIAWLEGAAEKLERREERIVEMMIAHVGKPRRAAQFEVRRSAAFIRGCARHVHGLGGETLPLDTVPAGAGLFGFTRRVPYGVVAAVTPFNAPSNLLLQKVAPALATGNAVVVKPCLEGSAIAVEIAQAFQEGGLPDGLMNVVTGDREEALALAAHPQTALVSLTGGTAAGEALSKAAGAKPFVAELGGNSPNLVCGDADIDDAVRRITPSAFEASGQQCISTQRIIVETSVFDEFTDRFLAATAKLKVGDPRDEKTDLGPVVSARAADRIEAMIEAARAQGARILCGPDREGCTIRPTIIAEPPPDARVITEEVFGPVAVLLRAADVDDALRIANDSSFGLQGSCFTSSLDTAFRVSERLNCGSVWINEASRFRLDNYPFGGMGRSGFGREGIRYAMEEFTQWKFTGIRFPQSR
jgi:acyl-CoA reductase-like NAD-dependent aldehyde dehydrogenase